MFFVLAPLLMGLFYLTPPEYVNHFDKMIFVSTGGADLGVAIWVGFLVGIGLGFIAGVVLMLALGFRRKK